MIVTKSLYDRCFLFQIHKMLIQNITNTVNYYFTVKIQTYQHLKLIKSIEECYMANSACCSDSILVSIKVFIMHEHVLFDFKQVFPCCFYY